MTIHHLRNATCVLECGDRHILVDPMIGARGTLPPFAHIRFKALRNPLVDLPDNAAPLLQKVTHCLITHSQKWGIRALRHSDHLDDAGTAFLRERRIPVATLARDAAALKKEGLHIEKELEYGKVVPFCGGIIQAEPAQHGHGWIRHFMANGAGYLVRFPDIPSLYLSGDTVFTPVVEQVLTEQRPDIVVMAAGTATLDVSTPILMTVDEMMRFVRTAPGLVIANHLEALNHCPTTRRRLKDALEKNGLVDRVWIPEDGEARTFN
ncbi:MAG: MBL fold metallo-hydrolase [Calditrichaeota bacterium]|nr:MAG: MBL fold metallo-hydrolase [Calditrichota bacterium]